MDIIRVQKRVRTQMRAMRKKRITRPRGRSQRQTHEPHVYQLGTARASRDVPFFGTSDYRVETPSTTTVDEREDTLKRQKNYYAPQQFSQDSSSIGTPISPHQEPYTRTQDTQDTTVQYTKTHIAYAVYHFGIVVVIIVIALSSVFFVGDVFAIKSRVSASGNTMVASVKQALAHAKINDMEQARADLHISQSALKDAQTQMDHINDFIIWSSQYIPGASKLASGDALIATATSLTVGGEVLMDFSQTVLAQAGQKDRGKINVLTIMQRGFDALQQAQQAFIHAEKSLRIVRLDDVPREGQADVLFLKKALPTIIEHFDDMISLRDQWEDAVGKNGKRTYLFLFQNNQEMRPTGGFIGSYGLLDLNRGRVESFFIDGIYNPDGQLHDKIVPPKPLQKISTAWSLHDSNWWPDFPTSAEVAIDFYERTGGKTPDGVIAITPTMIEKFLTITGPIELPEYHVTLDANNFISATQQNVEIDYDKEQNRPKKILSDFMPILSQKLLHDLSVQKMVQIVSAITEGLREKHIILYVRNATLENYIIARGWGGELIKTQGDYVQVVNTNINGFKTDGVIDQTITHQSEIQSDGRIIDTITITREHRGGHTDKPWWDRVNANYMRVYVPAGARLISARGYTREINEDRLAYDALGFTRHPLVVQEEQHMQLDPETGTRIYTNKDWTAFGNWVYVSPQEQVHVTYEYELPWRVRYTYGDATKQSVASHGVLFQKQSGDMHTILKSSLIVPSGDEIIWTSATDSWDNDQHLQSQHHTPLQQDHYHGIVFSHKEHE